ncbi:Microtubule-associated protein RP/EB family member 1C [Diplonema papillatum]|nr:Microtubule-associated protein RP/EB family member 1C [Diplonema papillatum]|eukprot:gene18276-28170_t
MGIKRVKARDFNFAIEAFSVPREEAIAWMNHVLELNFEEVEAVAARGAEWCQLLHYCVVPEEGVIDLAAVHFDESLSPEQVTENYAVLAAALRELQVDCPWLTGNEEMLAAGSYSEAIDLLKWFKAFVDHMGAPMFYHPQDERADVLRAAAAAREAHAQALEAEERERDKAARLASRAGRAGGVSRTVSRTGSMSRRPAGAPPATSATRTGSLSRRPLGGLRENVPQASKAPAKAAGGDALKKRVLELEGELEAKDKLATEVCLRFDAAFKKVNHFLNASSDIPPEAKARIAGILANSMN